MKINLVALLFAIFPLAVSAQSTSPNPKPTTDMQDPQLRRVQGFVSVSSTTITFSEYPVDTQISTQYRDVGIFFGGSGPVIRTDEANPTSPVLSGTPTFEGDITGSFVEPGTDRPTVVQSFTFDAGYFDEFGSTRIEWFDPDGKKLGQRINSELGIERFTFEGGNIANWRIAIVENEPNGFAIDNVSFVPIGPSILFRENADSKKDGTWGFIGDDIPGFDHVGFQFGNVVYESHPGYPSGTYVSADGNESVLIADERGVQWQHSRETFEHDSQSTFSTPVIDFEEIPIEEELANGMRAAIESVNASTFQFIDYSLDGLEETLSPSAQKGGGGSFTCIGLVEWAAEQAGHNGGQGFIPNSFESFTVGDPRNLFETIEVPLLSPQLLNYAMKGQQLLQGIKQWVQGLFDPVDFVVTDPIGRQLGFVHGEFINEIPNAFYSGDGGVEQILIPNAIPGPYVVELVGTGDNVFVGIADSESSENFEGFLAVNETKEKGLIVEPKIGSRGDVDGDGDVDQDDIDALSLLLNRFTDGLNHPGDLNGDGLLSDADVDLLTELVGVLVSVANEDEALIPERFTLGRNYPNPFTLETTIPFSLAKPQNITLEVIDVLGRVVQTLLDEQRPAGNGTVTFSANHLTSGVYFYRLRSEIYVKTLPMTVMK